LPASSAKARAPRRGGGGAAGAPFPPACLCVCAPRAPRSTRELPPIARSRPCRRTCLSPLLRPDPRSPCMNKPLHPACAPPPPLGFFAARPRRRRRPSPGTKTAAFLSPLRMPRAARDSLPRRAPPLPPPPPRTGDSPLFFSSPDLASRGAGRLNTGGPAAVCACRARRRGTLAAAPPRRGPLLPTNILVPRRARRLRSRAAPAFSAPTCARRPAQAHTAQALLAMFLKALGSAAPPRSFAAPLPPARRARGRAAAELTENRIQHPPLPGCPFWIFSLVPLRCSMSSLSLQKKTSSRSLPHTFPLGLAPALPPPRSPPAVPSPHTPSPPSSFDSLTVPVTTSFQRQAVQLSLRAGSVLS
jgi:hypothetical protein